MTVNASNVLQGTWLLATVGPRKVAHYCRPLQARVALYIDAAEQCVRHPPMYIINTQSCMQLATGPSVAPFTFPSIAKGPKLPRYIPPFPGVLEGVGNTGFALISGLRKHPSGLAPARVVSNAYWEVTKQNTKHGKKLGLSKSTSVNSSLLPLTVPFFRVTL